MYTQGVFESILQRWPLAIYALFFMPRVYFSDQGRFKFGDCPWVPGVKMRLDTLDNVWYLDGTFHGDVIDLHAARLGISRETAAKNLASYAVEVWT